MRALLCDLDNTMVDRAAAFVAWASAVAARHGQGDEFVTWLVEIDADGLGARPAFFVAIRDRLGLDDSVDTVTADYYREFLPLFRADAGVRAALESARAHGWRIAIVTNGPATQEDKIRHAGLADLVDTWCISDLEGHEKPDARLLEIAAARVGCSLDGAWMIGDNPDTDIAAAHTAGIDSVWLRRGRDWPRPDFRPTREADTFPGAVDVVLRCVSSDG